MFGDQRGYFLETWQAASSPRPVLPTRFVQDNHSHSAQWTLRGLHYQIEQTQGKLVRVTRGAVFDVAVDMRAQLADIRQLGRAELSDDEPSHAMGSAGICAWVSGA